MCIGKIYCGTLLPRPRLRPPPRPYWRGPLQHTARRLETGRTGYPDSLGGCSVHVVCTESCTVTAICNICTLCCSLRVELPFPCFMVLAVCNSSHIASHEVRRPCAAFAAARVEAASPCGPPAFARLGFGARLCMCTVAFL